MSTHPFTVYINMTRLVAHRQQRSDQSLSRVKTHSLHTPSIKKGSVERWHVSRFQRLQFWSRTIVNSNCSLTIPELFSGTLFCFVASLYNLGRSDRHIIPVPGVFIESERNTICPVKEAHHDFEFG